jgi:hypothetical protein
MERAPIGCKRGSRANISSFVLVMKGPACSHDAEGAKFQLADVRSLSGPRSLQVLVRGAAFAALVGVEELAQTASQARAWMTSKRMSSLRVKTI